MVDEIEEIRRKKLAELRNDDDHRGGDEHADGDDAGRTSPSEPIHVDGRSELQETVTEYPVVLVDFYADWCGPCQMLEPVVETIAAETDAAVGKVDIDANQALATAHGVRGVPTLVLFVDGEPVERLVGMQDEARLRSVIAQHA